MKNFLSIVSDPTRFGKGHYSRQKILKDAIEQKGFHYELIINQNEMKTPRIRKNTTLILDISNLDIEPKLSFPNNFEKSIAFDWVGSFVPDVNIVIMEHPDKLYSFKTTKFLGFKYLIINDKLLRHRANFLKENKGYVLISLGYRNDSSKYFDAVSQVRKYTKIPIIIASGIPIDLPCLENVTIVINPSNFYDLIFNAELIVSNAGTTLMESLCCGKTVIPIPQTLDEKRFLNEVYNFTQTDGTFPNSIKLIDKDSLKDFFDFNGSNRVIEILMGD